MKLHPIIIAAAAALAPAFADENKSTASSSVTVKSGGDGSGKATVTIEVNGKKEVREIDLGNATEIKVEAGSQKPEKSQHVTYLGVAPDDLPEEVAAQLPIAKGEGILVRSIIPNSPAANAGLQKNDVLLRLDDQVLTNARQLKQLVMAKKAGDSVRLTYFRTGQKSEVEAKLTEQDETVLDVKFDAKGGGGFGWLRSLQGAGPLFEVQKKAVIVDKDGNVQVTGPNEKLDQSPEAKLDKITRLYTEALSPDQMKKFDAQLEKVQQQLKVAQERAAEAMEQATKAVQKAAEAARVEIEKARQASEAEEKKAPAK